MTTSLPLPDIFALIGKRDILALKAATYDPATLNSLDSIGRAPLHIAASIGDYQLASALIDLGADLNVTDNDLRTPLHYAAETQQLDVVRLLVERGADTGAKDILGEVPLHYIHKSTPADTLECLQPNSKAADCRQQAILRKGKSSDLGRG